MSVAKRDEALETGVAPLDEQHQQLLTHLTRLRDAIAHGESASCIEINLVWIGGFIQLHFGREERCMAAWKCPTAQANRQAHAEFIRRFDVVRSNPLSGKEGVRIIETELLAWFFAHVSGVDGALHQCVNPAGA